jgi:hypothetical protein
MASVPPDMSEYAAIAEVVQRYIDGARSGKSDEMKRAFHEDATIFGHDGPELFAGPIKKLFDWEDENGPAPELEAQIVSIDLVETIAAVRLELDNWTGIRFSDLFTLLKIDGQWKIINKVFHEHVA